MGGSILAQCFGEMGESVPDVSDAGLLKSFFTLMQATSTRDKVIAYHDRSDGGVFISLLEMAFASRCGIEINLEVDDDSHVNAMLFNEETGAVLQVADEHTGEIVAAFANEGLKCTPIAKPLRDQKIVINVNGQERYCESRGFLQKRWSETSFHIQRLRDNPDCADEEFARIEDDSDPGLTTKICFDINEDIAAPYISTGIRPGLAILREQGVNSQVEMAAAFHRAGFNVVDVHMTDILDGRVTLDQFKGLVACGGFSYGDVLGAGEGWAKSILFNPAVRQEFQQFFNRQDTFALGVCNGCQMMASLKELIPGASMWPKFVTNRSEQFEARFSLVQIQEVKSILFHGMAGSHMPIAVSHGEGRAEIKDSAADELLAIGQVALRFVDHYLEFTETYPANPNGSLRGIAGLTNEDGRFTVIMPHPERVYRTVQNSWRPGQWQEDSPWMRLFRNARVWVD